MHFVARNSTEAAYQVQGYSLRNDPLMLFRQPPTNLITRPIPSPNSHRRQHSAGSLKQMTNLGKPKDPQDDGPGPELVRLVSVERSDEGFVDEPKTSTDGHCCDIEGCRRVIINVAGQKYETQLKTLNRLPSTLLGNHTKRQQFWDPYRKEYFFDRHRPSFPAVLYYYQSGGRLKRPVEVPMDIFLEELQFYQLGDSVIEAFKVNEGFLVDDDDGEELPNPKNHVLKSIWNLFEYPDSSLGAKIVSAFSIFFILTSVVIFCLETEPTFKNIDCVEVNVTQVNGTEKILRKPYYGHPLFIIETICVAWFVIELFMRAISCPSFIKFVKSLINWIDLASIAPYFIFLTMILLNDSCQSGNKLSFLRVLRVVRVFKLSRFSTGLQILAKTLRISLKELSMFILFLGIGIVIFAGAIYYAEAQNDTSHFISIPDAFWWAVISMTTVGYGDVYPTSNLGKFIGSLCVLSGLLCIALPVPVIVTNFNNIYRQTTGRGINA